MHTIEQSLTQVNARLRKAGFGERDLASFEFPAAEYVDAVDNTQVPTVTFGDVHEAPRILAVSTPYSTELQSPHYLLRLAAMHTGLGESYALVGSQLFHPKDQPLNKLQQKQVSQGNFTPLVDRQLTILDRLGLSDDQGVIMHGQSMGADVATELAYSNRFNEHRGSVSIAALGVVEPARTAKRPLGGLGMMLAFGRSGGELSQNVLQAKIPALHEAWKIPLEADANIAKKIVNKTVNAVVLNYAKANLANNWALARGFATTRTLEQLELLLGGEQYPVTVVRSHASAVFTEKAFDTLSLHNPNDVFEVSGDHSRDDNIRKAGQLALFVASRAA